MRGLWIWVLTSFFCGVGFQSAKGQCDFAPNQPISFQASGGQVISGYTQVYVLTDHSGVILDIQSVPSFAGRGAGLYIAYHLNYESTSAVTGVVIGGNVRNIAGDCLDLSNPLVLNVCAGNETCDFSFSQPISFQASGANVDPAYVQLYLLTNEVGDILVSSLTPSFPPQSPGLYLIYHATYLATESFETASCLDISNPLAIRICQNELLAVADQTTATAGVSTTISVLANDLFNSSPVQRNQVRGPSLIVLPTKGNATVLPDGSIQYVPAQNQSGTDQFIYQICSVADSTQCAQALVTISVQAAPFLVVSKSGPAAANVGLPIQYTLSVLNQGALGSSGNITLLDDLPVGLQFVSAVSSSLFSCTAVGQSITCVRSISLAAGASASVQINVISSTTGLYSNQARLFGGGDPTAANQASARTSNVVNTLIGNQAVRVAPRVFLYGAYVPTDGLMRDNLRSNGLLPFLQPYQLPIYQDIGYAGTETVSPSVLSISGANAIVDWVIVELRSPSNPAQTILRKAALIQRDGDVVETDGVQPVTFMGASAGDYYVAVRHRNHLAVMSATPLALTPIVSGIDFTLPTTPTYRLVDGNGSAFAQIVMPNGRTALWAGNATVDRRIIFQGTTNDVNGVFNRIISFPGNVNQFANYIVTGYDRADLNLDGQTIYQGTGNDNNLLFMQVLSHPENIFTANNFIIHQQLP